LVKSASVKGETPVAELPGGILQLTVFSLSLIFHPAGVLLQNKGEMHVISARWFM